MATVRMVRGELYADVHPDEVGNYSQAGWALVEQADAEEDESPELYSVYKIKDGEKSTRASKADIPLTEAKAYVADRPDVEYIIERVDD